MQDDAFRDLAGEHLIDRQLAALNDGYVHQ